jgi:hypothetical protein
MSATFLKSEEIHSPKIFEGGSSVDFEDLEKPISGVFERPEPLYVSPPDFLDGFFGPVAPNASISLFAFPGYRPTFVSLPSVPNPVFFVIDTSFKGVFDKLDLVSSFGQDFSFYFNSQQITDFAAVPTGSIIKGIPKGTVFLAIDGTTEAYPENATYEEVQLQVAGPANKDRAAQLLFYSAKGVPLNPRENPTALHLYDRHPLKSRWLTAEATVCSVGLFSPLTIDLYDSAHKTTNKDFLWIRKGSPIREMTARIPEWFGLKRDKSAFYVVSPKSQHDFVTKILSDDQPLNNTKLRVDVLPCPLLGKCSEIRGPLEEGTPV